MKRRSVAALAVLAMAACDIPTEAPVWDQEWQVPIPSGSLNVTVDELLPPSVLTSPDGEAFVATVPGVTRRFAITDVCGVCVGFSGTAPIKPEFEATLMTVTRLPDELVAATVEGGDMALEVTHTFRFDPLRPAGSSEPGWLVVEARSDGNVLARDSIDGADRSFAANTPLRPELRFQPVKAAGDIEIALRLYSPEGDGTVITGTEELVVAVRPSELRIADATIAVEDQAVGPEQRTVALQLDSTLVEHVQSGALLVTVGNPFEVTGQVSVDFELASRTIRESVPLEMGTARQRVELSGDELRDVLNEREVDLALEGDLSAPNGTVTVEPGQAIEIALSLELVVLVGDTDGGV